MDFEKYFREENFSAAYSIEAWNALTFEKFGPYFRSADELYDCRALLRVELVNLARLEQKPDYFRLFNDIYLFYSTRIDLDPDSSLFEMNEMSEENNNTDFTWMSLVNSQIDPSRLDLRDKISYFFEIIDRVVEGVFRPRLLHLFRFAIASDTGTFPPIQHQSLGNIVDRFPMGAIPNIATILFDPILHVKISQWRNIATHKSYKIGPDSVSVHYGDKLQHEGQLSHVQVEAVLDWVLDSYAPLRLAQVLVYLDRIDDIKAKFILKIPEFIRFDAHLFGFIHNMELVGFQFASVEDAEGCYTVNFYAHTTEDLTTSIIHSSQGLERIADAIELDPMTNGKYQKVGIRNLSRTSKRVLAEARVLVEDALKKIHGDITQEEYVNCVEFRFSRPDHG